MPSLNKTLYGSMALGMDKMRSPSEASVATNAVKCRYCASMMRNIELK